MSYESLPQSIRDIIDLCGHDATMALVQHYGGRQLVVPYGIKDGSTKRRLVKLMGLESATAFMEQYGGEWMTIANCSAAFRAIRDAKMQADFKDGMSAARLAVKYGMCERNVKFRLKMVPGEAVPGLSAPAQEDDKQLGLF